MCDQQRVRRRGLLCGDRSLPVGLLLSPLQPSVTHLQQRHLYGPRRKRDLRLLANLQQLHQLGDGDQRRAYHRWSDDNRYGGIHRCQPGRSHDGSKQHGRGDGYGHDRRVGRDDGLSRYLHHRSFRRGRARRGVRRVVGVDIRESPIHRRRLERRLQLPR